MPFPALEGDEPSWEPSFYWGQNSSSRNQLVQPLTRLCLPGLPSCLPKSQPLPSPSRVQQSLAEGPSFPAVPLPGQDCPWHPAACQDPDPCPVSQGLNAHTVRTASSLAADSRDALIQPGHELLLSFKIFPLVNGLAPKQGLCV